MVFKKLSIPLKSREGLFYFIIFFPVTCTALTRFQIKLYEVCIFMHLNKEIAKEYNVNYAMRQVKLVTKNAA